MSVSLLDGPRAIIAVDPAVCSLAYGPNLLGLCEWDGALVPPGRSRWCSTACEVAFDEAHIWTLARAAASRRAAHRCRRCNSRDEIEVHHDPPVPLVDGYAMGCQHHSDRLVVLCRKDHRAAHANLRAKPGKQLTLFAA